MIHSKPKTSTLTSLLLFLFALSASLAYIFKLYWFDGSRTTWVFISLGFLIPTTLLLFGRIVFGYKTLKIHKDTFFVTYPIRVTTHKYPLGALEKWTENTVKTGNGLYREVVMEFGGRKKIKFADQEHSEYAKILNYLKRKAPKQFVPEKA